MRLIENTALAPLTVAHYCAFVRIDERIKAARRAKRMTQKALAKEAEVSLRTVQKVEAGSSANMTTARKLLAALGDDFDEERAALVITEADRLKIAEFVDWLQEKFVLQGSKKPLSVTPSLRPDVQSGPLSDEEQNLDRDRGDGEQK